ncbi:phospholipase ABHD3 isoform X2 [Ostrinia nubilalis]|uniref:phospholipase ABHD3 isoform X2 n=1 Tax=Ostrinia nubilalis TaxID=29057 RepID=UPI00308234A6
MHVKITYFHLFIYGHNTYMKPILICRKGEFREFLEENVPLLNEHYWPTPWCLESRLQTVIGSVLRTRLLPAVKYRREILQLSDGGQVALDWAEGAAGAGGEGAVLLVLPGLTGDSRADYVRCLAAAAAALGARCVVFNNRGLGGLPLTTPRLYCAVSHADLAEVVAAVRGRGPLLCAGVSLGGLILGHYLAEHGERSGVDAALVVSSPLDVVKGSECIERPPLNALLSYHMARNLRNTLRAHAPLRAGPWDWAAVQRSRSVREFDAAFTTKHFGFGSVEAYYRAATLRDKLSKVRVPLLCLCAADDPFQPLDAIPVREAEESPSVALLVTARGGHIGFLEGWWPTSAPPSHHYIARLAQQYFAALLRRPGPLRARDPALS